MSKALHVWIRSRSDLVSSPDPPSTLLWRKIWERDYTCILTVVWNVCVTVHVKAPFIDHPWQWPFHVLVRIASCWLLRVSDFAIGNKNFCIYLLKHFRCLQLPGSQNIFPNLCIVIVLTLVTWPEELLWYVNVCLWLGMWTGTCTSSNRNVTLVGCMNVTVHMLHVTVILPSPPTLSVFPPSFPHTLHPQSYLSSLFSHPLPSFPSILTLPSSPLSPPSRIERCFIYLTQRAKVTLLVKR